MRIVYLVGAYIGDGTYAAIDRNISKAEKYAIDLANCGIAFICPHLNSQHFGSKASRTESFYIEMYLEIVSRCDGCAVMPNYQTSSGSMAEIKRANSLGKPVFYLPGDWGTLNAWYRGL